MTSGLSGLSGLSSIFDVGSPFTPSDVGGLQFWNDADDIDTLWIDSAGTNPVSSDGDVVGKHDDKSGNGNHIIQATTSKKPLYKINVQNGRAGILYDGIDDLMENAAFASTISQPNTSFIVAILSSINEIFFDGLDISNRQILQGTTGNVALINAGGTSRKGTTAIVGSVNLITVVWNGASSELRINGGDNEISLSPGNHSIDGIITGTYFGKDALFLNGHIFEHLIYNGALSSDNRTLIEGYLISKWGL